MKHDHTQEPTPVKFPRWAFFLFFPCLTPPSATVLPGISFISNTSYETLKSSLLQRKPKVAGPLPVPPLFQSCLSSISFASCEFLVSLVLLHLQSQDTFRTVFQSLLKLPGMFCPLQDIRSKGAYISTPGPSQDVICWE